MRWTLMLEVGWCGFGASGGLVPELRLGLLRVAVTRGGVADRLRGMLRTLGDAAAMLRNAQRPRIVPAPLPKDHAP